MFDQYHQVLSEYLKALKTKTNSLEYDVSQPIDSFFNKVNRLSQISEAARIPKTKKQALEMAIRILQRSGLMATTVDAWEEIAEADQKWEVLGKHFWKEH